MGAPPMIAGSASTGSASAVVICSPVEAVSAAAASPPSTPAFCSITTVNGVAEPGTIRPSALPANCEDAIGNHPFEANAIRSSSHKHNELATSKRSTRAAKGQSRCSSERQEEKTEIRPGRSR
jgi:hypothetical protein